MPKVSVIIPVYNCEKYVRDAIKSVLAQTYKDFELIVVDDGSTDNSGRIVREEFARMAGYYYQPNRGAASARNAGVKHSAGEYIGFLDADDLWLPEKLATQVPILDSNPGTGVVHCASEIVDSSGRHLKIWKTFGCKDGYAQQFVQGHVISPDALLIRKEIFVSVGGYDEEFADAAYEDLEFSIRVAQVCRIYCVERPLVKVRFWGTARHDEATVLRNRGILLRKMREQFGHYAQDNRFLLREQARYYSDSGRFLIKDGKPLEGRRRLLESILLGLRTFDLQIACRSSLRLVRSLV